MIKYLPLFLFSIFASQSWYALAAVPTNVTNSVVNSSRFM